MKLTGESKLFIAILAATAILVVVAAMLFTKPAPTVSREDLMPKDAHTKGNPQAKAYLVEFSDFQCPACLAAKPAVDEVLKTHTSDLLFVYRHFPLDQHPFGQKAAQAAEAAAKQGKFWEMYDLLFANQDKFSDTLFLELAKQLHLDESQFAKDIENSDLKNIISSDQADGNRFGVNATPTFFLNGKKLELASFADLKTAVEEAVK